MDWQAFFSPGDAVMAMPNWDKPRVFFPAKTGALRWQGAAFMPAFRKRARAMRWLMRCRAVLSQSVKIANTDGAISAWINARLPEAAWWAVSVGTAAQAQKLTARIFDHDGKVIAYLKHAARPAAIVRLRHEHRILGALPAGLGPHPLDYGQTSAGESLLLARVQGAPLSAKRLNLPAIQAFLERADLGQRFAVADHPGFAAAIEYGQAMARWIDDLADTRWGRVVAHGDLLPWNCFIGRDQSITAIDWEYGSLDGIAHVDLAYALLHSDALLHRASPGAAIDNALRVMSGSWPGLSQKHARALLALAAFEAHRQAIADGDAPGEWLQCWQREIWNIPPRLSVLSPRPAASIIASAPARALQSSATIA